MRAGPTGRAMLAARRLRRVRSRWQLRFGRRPSRPAGSDRRLLDGRSQRAPAGLARDRGGSRFLVELPSSYAELAPHLATRVQALQKTIANGDFDDRALDEALILEFHRRVCADLTAQDAELEEGRIERWRGRLSPWTEKTREFRNEGFYERFPAKGQIERVARIHRELGRAAGIQSRSAGRKGARGEES